MARKATGKKREKTGRPAVWRLLDANANRSREGLRIVEDTARFVLNDGAAAKSIRAVRHELDRLVRAHYRQLLSARDVSNDSGRSNVASKYEGGVADLLAANFKRCEEAFRVLEEYGRVLSPKAVGQAQALRFRMYQLEKRMVLSLSHGTPRAGKRS